MTKTTQNIHQNTENISNQELENLNLNSDNIKEQSNNTEQAMPATNNPNIINNTNDSSSLISKPESQHLQKKHGGDVEDTEHSQNVNYENNAHLKQNANAQHNPQEQDKINVLEKIKNKLYNKDKDKDKDKNTKIKSDKNDRHRVSTSSSSSVLSNHSSSSNTSRSSLEQNDYIRVPESLNWIPQANARKRIREHYFTKERDLGSGVSGSVSCVYFHGQPQQKFALKAIRRDNKWGDILFSTEARILGHIQHPGVVKLMNCFLDQENFYLLTEMGHIDLFNRIKNNKRLPEDSAKGIITKILQTLTHLHEKNVVHRDLKPENIVFTGEDPDQPKFIDFGDAILVSTDDVYTEFVGTPCYLSPERLREHRGWELKASDVWTVGVMTYEMVTGKRCFYGKNHREIFHRIRKGEWKWPKEYRPSSLCQDFVESLLDRDATARPTATRALQHPWLLSEDQPQLLPSLMSQASGTSNSSISSCTSSQASIQSTRTISEVYSEGHCAPIFKNLASNIKSTNRLKDLIIRQKIQKLNNTDKAHINSVFQELDRNHDGFIDISDLLDGFTEEGMSPNEAAALARTIIFELDRGNKGRISVEDFAVSHLAYRLSHSDKSLKRLFAQFSGQHGNAFPLLLNNNSDHSNSPNSEIKAYLTPSALSNSPLLGSLKISTEEASKIIAEYDHDGDGKLNFNEFKRAMLTPLLIDTPLSLSDINSDNTGIVTSSANTSVNTSTDTFPSPDLKERRISTIDEQNESLHDEDDPLSPKLKIGDGPDSV